jgi:hypothetical protein
MLSRTLPIALALLPTALAAAAPRQVTQGQTAQQIESVSTPGQVRLDFVPVPVPSTPG